MAWYRTSIDLSESQARAASHLLVGKVGEQETSWINGTLVGFGTIHWLNRKYAVPKGVFRPGRNVIVMRVLVQEAGAGLASPARERAIRADDGQLIALPAVWRYQLGSPARRWAAPRAPWEISGSLTTMDNGMIAPLAGYRFKLVAWYQGESNTDNAHEYRTLLRLLMADWRQTFGRRSRRS